MAHKVSHRLKAAATGVYVDPGCNRSTAVLNKVVESLTPPDSSPLRVRLAEMWLGKAGGWAFAAITLPSGFIAHYRMRADFDPETVQTVGDIKAHSLYPCDPHHTRGAGKLFKFTVMEE